MKKHDIVIGIDCGVKTGVAIWQKQEKYFSLIETLPIHKAMDLVKDFGIRYTALVRVEDARQRKWFGNAGKEKLQGAGSIKRDSTIWEDFLKDLGIDYQMVAPKSNKTKLSAEQFKTQTKCELRTSEHSRDAAMLCYGY